MPMLSFCLVRGVSTEDGARRTIFLGGTALVVLPWKTRADQDRYLALFDGLDWAATLGLEDAATGVEHRFSIRIAPNWAHSTMDPAPRKIAVQNDEGLSFSQHEIGIRGFLRAWRDLKLVRRAYAIERNKTSR